MGILGVVWMYFLAFFCDLNSELVEFLFEPKKSNSFNPQSWGIVSDNLKDNFCKNEKNNLTRGNLKHLNTEFNTRNTRLTFSFKNSNTVAKIGTEKSKILQPNNTKNSTNVTLQNLGQRKRTKKL
jgi:hypothetical protein